MTPEVIKAYFALSSALAQSLGNPYCEAACSHGGRCVLREGHAGPHDSRFCRWES